MKKIGRGQKLENELPELKNGIWAIKSVLSYDISIDRMDPKISFWALIAYFHFSR
jgi:hypothetical protein